MALKRDEAAEIYRNSYWNAIRGDDLPSGIDLALFDFCVNSGPSRAIRAFQSSIGLKQDGVMDDDVVTAADRHDVAVLIHALSARRLSFLHRLSTLKVFGRGWSRRVKGIETAALQLAGATPV